MKRPSIRKAFGQVLQEARKKLGVSQEEMALKCGIDRAYASRLERGVTQPTLKTIFRLSKGLTMSPSELVSRVEQKRPTTEED